jgi:hypothetical protein
VATVFFGRRIVERLALQPGVEVVIAGRSPDRCEALARTLRARLAAPISACALDASAPDVASRLAAMQPDVVVHCAGPFQTQERGLSTVQAVLSYCGRRIGPSGSADVFGWSGTWERRYPASVGSRLLSPCDVPDLALLAARYPGSPRVRFGAGLELRFLHRGITVLAWLVRRRLVGNLLPHASRLKQASDWFRHWGSDAGAMHVRVTGTAAHGGQVTREWLLVAASGDGPYVPTLAATALVLRLAQGNGLPCGAAPCVGLLTSKEILAGTDGLAINAGELPASRIFRQAMGASYERVYSAVRAFHDLQGRAELRGEVETDGPSGALGSLLAIAIAIGAPRVPTRGSLRFDLHCEPDQQTWIRHFPRRSMRWVARRRFCTHGVMTRSTPSCCPTCAAKSSQR